MKRTVLILSNSISGLFSFRKEVVQSIIESGYCVYISCPIDNNEQSDYFVSLGVKLISTPINRRGINPFRDMVLIVRYLRLVKSINPSAVLTYTIKPNIYGGIVSWLCRVPQIANITGLGDAIENPGIISKITTSLYRFGLRKARVVMYQNISIQQFCQKNRIGKKGCLLPGSGVNLTWHPLEEYPDEDAPMRFNFIGRVLKDKGIEEFFEMARLIHAKYPFTEFHIIGGCEDSYELELAKLEREQVLVWHGEVSDVRPFIKISYATIHPSYHEGMANVILESCAMGRPVIACNINGCKEAIDDSVNGFLCRVKDTNDLSEKVEKFINLPYERKKQMGISARLKMEKEFDRRLVIDRYLDILKSI